MTKIGYIAAIFILSALITSGFLIEPKFKTANIIQEFIDKIPGLNNNQAELDLLRKENSQLKTLLLDRKTKNELNPIKVYSSYPFNNAKEIAIASGSEHGIKEGDIVTYGTKTLIGRVKSLSQKSSIVSTIFDQDWEIPVRIGEKEIDALLKGGNSIKAILISKDAPIKPGDLIISAGAGLPYGLAIGTVKEIVGNKMNIQFKEVSVEPIIKMNELKNVSIYN